MSERRFPFTSDAFYHIYNRGADKRVIFQDSVDHYRFLELLFLSNSTQAINIRNIRDVTKSIFEFDRGEQLVAIGAYCLMPNHFHILLTPLREGGVQTFMRKLSTGYSMYFNKRYERNGVLFQGRYKSQFVDSDQYLKYLYSYIHLNPLKLIQKDWKEIGLNDIPNSIEYLSKYKFSSYLDFVKGDRLESGILNIEPFPIYFEDTESFLNEIEEWMTYGEVLNGNKTK